MYLSKVEIVGFKSFPIKTDLKFTDGLTAVVGPNGCGKTNIVDAIRWALGEQKAGVLRSDVMENVIFNGTRTRKPLGMAEVAITVLNNKQILPLEFSEITITRRLFRNGESQYLLNNTQCRLRDITELFMDTGMGADAYSVIELKMVESILSDRAEERRHLFEEAAGVTKYKTRRREAMRKLMAVNDDLARVEDIVLEVQKTVNSLGRQADKARQYKEIEGKSRILERSLVQWEYSGAAANAADVEHEFGTLQKQKSKLHDAVATAEIQLREVEQHEEELRNNLEQISRREQDLNRSIGQLNQQIAVAAERRSSLETARLRLEAEASEATGLTAKLSESRQNFIEQLATAKEQTFAAETALEKRRTIRQEATAHVTALREQFRGIERDMANFRTVIGAAQTKRERAAERAAGLRRRRDELTAEHGRTGSALDEIKRQLSAHSERSNEIILAVTTAENALKSGEERVAALRSNKEQAQHRISEFRSELAHAQASVEFLGGLADTTESSQYLLKASSWQPGGEKSLLAELVGADEEYRIAIESALGEAGGCFVVQTRADALAGCAMLRSSGKGKSTFICRDEISPVPLPGIAPGGSFGWASELVRCDDTLRFALRALLGRTVIVETLDDAFAIVARGGADAAVSRAGEIVRANGMLRGGSVAKTEGLRVGKREQIAALNHKIATLKSEIAAAEGAVASINSELSGINIQHLVSAVRRAETDKSGFEQQEKHLRYRVESLEHLLAQNASQTEKIAQDIAAAEQETTTFAEEYEKLRGNAAEREEIAQQALADIRTAEEALRLAEHETQQAHIGVIQTSGRRDSLQRELSRIEEQIAAAERRTAQRENERKDISRQMEEVIRTARTAEEDVGLMRDQRDALRETKDGLSKKAGTYRTEHTSLAQEIRGQREQHDRLTTIAHERELRLAELRSRMQTLYTNAVENLEMTPEDLIAPPDTEPPTPEHHQELRRLKQKLASLGNVNFLAVEEFRQENERLMFLKTQTEDLRQSKQTLDETIAEINSTAQQKFIETFGVIARHFGELFGLLFGEHAEASVRLAEGDPLEADIEIVAKPAGKRPQSIELLSAGEKTLTSIALLFAIYLVKPSPFCILDEVDAPLDDANIERYLELIRKFSENTQFLIVTHNKKTMEAADILYGVTQEEEGVSRVVSARFSERIKEAV